MMPRSNSSKLPDALSSYVNQQLEAIPTENDWGTALKQKDFTKAATLLDEAVTASPNDLMTRLAWIRTHLELNAVPTNALSAALTELVSALKENDHYAGLGISVHLLLAGRLAEKNQFRLAISLVEAVNELTESSKQQANGIAVDIGNYYISLIDAELESAKTKRNSAEYVSKLEQKKKTFVKLLASSPARATEKKPVAKAEPFNSKALFQAASNTESLLENKEIREEENQTLDLSSDRPHSLTPKILLAAGLFLALFGLYTLLIKRPPETSRLVLAMNTELNTPTAEPVLPEVNVAGSERISERLTSVHTNLDQVGERIKNLGGQIENNSGNSTEKDPDQEVRQLEKPAPEKQPSSETKDEELEAISGPTASASAPSAPVPKLPAANAPYLDPGKLVNIPVEDLNKSDSRALDELRLGQDGRIYGPPASQDITKNQSGVRSLDGSPVHSYEVEEFDVPRVYRTIVPTNVLSSPSLRSVSLSRLDRNASIQVISRMGPWLELRSAGGRKGYIYAQDAAPADDSSFKNDSRDINPRFENDQLTDHLD